MRKIRYFICFIFLQTSLLYAYDPYQAITEACEQLSSACEELVGCYEEQCNPIYLPVEKCCYWGIFNFYAEYIWWHIYQDQLHFAISGVQQAVPGEGKLFAFDGHWDSGFRIGTGIFFPCNSWKLNFDWLRFTTDEQIGVGPQGGLILRATRGFPGDIDVLDAANADFDFKLNMYRFTLEVPLFTRTHIALKPLIRLRGDRIVEDFLVGYIGGESGFFSSNLKYWGVGPEAGLNAVWYLISCFSLYGEGSIAALYGNFDVHQTQADFDADDDVNFRSRFDRIVTTLSSSLGIQWEGVFFKNLYLALKLSWETNIWFNQNTLYSFFSDTEEGNLAAANGNLYTNGLTFRASISF